MAIFLRTARPMFQAIAIKLLGDSKTEVNIAFARNGLTDQGATALISTVAATETYPRSRNLATGTQKPPDVNPATFVLIGSPSLTRIELSAWLPAGR